MLPEPCVKGVVVVGALVRLALFVLISRQPKFGLGKPLSVQCYWRSSKFGLSPHRRVSGARVSESYALQDLHFAMLHRSTAAGSGIVLPLNVGDTPGPIVELYIKPIHHAGN